MTEQEPMPDDEVPDWLPAWAQEFWTGQAVGVGINHRFCRALAEARRELDETRAVIKATVDYLKGFVDIQDLNAAIAKWERDHD